MDRSSASPGAGRKRRRRSAAPSCLDLKKAASDKYEKLKE